MIEFVLGESDLVDVRFAVSPLSELTLSLRVLKNPAKYPLHLPWVRRIRDVDTEVLLALSTDRGWTPDFLSPRPSTPFTRIEDEFAALREIPTPHSCGATSSAVFGDVPPCCATAAGCSTRWRTTGTRPWPATGTGCARCSKPTLRTAAGRWPSTAWRRCSRGSPTGSRSPAPWCGCGSRVPDRRRVEAGGQGLTLVPSVFARRTAVPVDPGAPPLLIYAARGAGTVWETGLVRGPAALAGVLGQVRADLLAELAEPCSSTDSRTAHGRHDLGGEPAPAGVARRRPAGLATARPQRRLRPHRTRRRSRFPLSGTGKRTPRIRRCTGHELR